ncbi:MAG: DUF5655 domain-containing protein [Bacteroidales bacterium]|nr:DUF5655 domain-containing protein [Bacteroidales bacterium]MCF8403149.1 DUF5655 domain-containing protein [Bacteroidales bacterium]
MWTCPDCKRTFKNTNQSHSCLITDITSHFINKNQEVTQTFEKLVQEISHLKKVKINSLKNAILFTAKTHFLAIKPKTEFLDIEFVLPEKLEGFPIHKTVQASKYRWAHFVRLGSPEEVDKQLLDWIKQAYDVSG